VDVVGWHLLGFWCADRHLAASYAAFADQSATGLCLVWGKRLA